MKRISLLPSLCLFVFGACNPSSTGITSLDSDPATPSDPASPPAAATVQTQDITYPLTSGCDELDCDVTLAPSGLTETRAECMGEDPSPVADPYAITEKAVWNGESSKPKFHAIYVNPVVGQMTDDDGDGDVDSDDSTDIALVACDYTQNADCDLILLDGKTLIPHFTRSGFAGYGGLAMARIDTGSGTSAPHLIAISSGNRAVAIDSAGNQAWGSPSRIASRHPQPIIADLKADGSPEVLVDNLILDASDGSVQTTIPLAADKYRVPAAGDLDGDGEQEFVLDGVVYNADGTIAFHTALSGYPGWPAIADVNGDGLGDVIFLANRQLVIHESDGTLLVQVTLDGSTQQAPVVADITGDGSPEIAWSSHDQMELYDTDGTLLATSTASLYADGLPATSAWDFDGDGDYELVTASRSGLHLFDYVSGSLVKVWSTTTLTAGHVWDYPVVADVDGDGSAELIAGSASSDAADSGLHLFGHTSNQWGPAGESWQVHDFTSTNILPDSTIPSPPEAAWDNHNLYRARPWSDHMNPRPDLEASVIDVCAASCQCGPAKVSYQVRNTGGQDVLAGTLVSLYVVTDDIPVLIDQHTLGAIASGEVLEGQVFEFPATQLGDSIEVVVDDGATAVGQIEECSEDNTAFWLDNICN